MNKKILKLINTLEKKHSLSKRGYRKLIENYSAGAAELLAEKARTARAKVYKNHVYIRGLIEISNICKNDCL